MSVPATETGDASPHFRADLEKQVTHTVGVNPGPPAARSRSVPANSPPPPYVAPGDCVFGPYDGLSC